MAKDYASRPVTWARNLRPRDDSGGPFTHDEQRTGEFGDGYKKIAPMDTGAVPEPLPKTGRTAANRRG